MPTAFAIAAHPDDIEFVMAGTMMLLGQAGFDLHYMNVSSGNCGSTEQDAETTIRIRRGEAQSAARFLNATFHESLTNDLEIFYEKSLLTRLAAIVRSVAPTILLTHSPQDYMEDHMITSRLAVSAAFARGMPNFPASPACSAIDQPVTVYHAQPHGNCDGLGQPIVPSLFVDISSVIDQKTEMLALHQSQKSWLDRSQGMDSYLLAMQQQAAAVAKLSGKFAFAEGWRRHSHMGFCAESADPLREVLAGYIC
ncbi:MAG: PIG-L family deacetylase [Planctomycetota bacterium]|nr:PIG-L family deacetylase [Planctomycetota bacterium]